jgi:predicted urease superfamily metal-dependent hydrolase
VAPVDAHMQNKAQNSQIKNYVAAREAGLQPKSVFKHDVDTAWRKTEETGTPFRADQ